MKDKNFIPLNKPMIEINKKYISESINNYHFSGGGPFSRKCEKWFEKKLNCSKALLTSSCTHALEMAAILTNIQEGDEVIMPSYTFTSTANAFVLRGAKIIFVDIRPDTMNIDESKIEQAITKKTKAIVVVHYAGISCEMDKIMALANKNHIFVIEDAAQAMGSSYKGNPLGTIGHLGTYSFHESKNYTSGGEGGLLIINDNQFVSRAEIIREKGTDRAQFFRGTIKKYSWIDIGSSFLMNDISAAFLWGQLEKYNEIKKDRLFSWNFYYDYLQELKNKKMIVLPTVPYECSHNAHIFYIKVKNLKTRRRLLKYLNSNKINATFHYIPLHSSYAGSKYGVFIGDDEYTTVCSEQIIRLPLWYGISTKEKKYVIDSISNFFQ